MGKYAYGGKVIHDAHPQGWLPFYKILQVSSNIGFTKVAEKLKRERYFKYIEKFGYGKTTGIDLPGEIPGLCAVSSPGRRSIWRPMPLAKVFP